MSRIGKIPITIPKGVYVTLQEHTITIKGVRGELKWTFPQELQVSTQDTDKLVIERIKDSRKNKALHGLSRSLINNMVTGVTQGFQRVLVIEGTGYRARKEGQSLVLSLGYSHPVTFKMPEGIQADVDPKQTKITINGIDKQVVGQVAANLRQLRPPDAYKGKGIRYENERLRLKVGKKG